MGIYISQIELAQLVITQESGVWVCGKGRFQKSLYTYCNCWAHNISKILLERIQRKLYLYINTWGIRHHIYGILYTLAKINM